MYMPATLSYRQQYYIDHKQAINAAAKLYRAKNREKIFFHKQQYRAKNKEEIANKKREYYLTSKLQKIEMTNPLPTTNIIT